MEIQTNDAVILNQITINPNYIDLNSIVELTDIERNSIREHCALSGLINRMIGIRSFLIKEIHEKRADFKRNTGRYKIRDPATCRLYTAILYGGKRGMSSLASFPCNFRGNLDGRLLKSIDIKRDPVLGFSLCNVYYNPEHVPLEDLHTASQFDETEWTLNHPTGDCDILLRFRHEFTDALSQLADAAKWLKCPAKNVAVLEKEIKRYMKVSSH